MKSPLRVPPGNAAFNTLLFLALAAFLIHAATKPEGLDPLRYAALAASVAAAIGYWQQMGWARWIAVACCGWAILEASTRMVMNGFSIYEAFIVVAGLYGGHTFWNEAITPEEIAREKGEGESGEESEEEASRPMTSLVLLLREPRYLDGAILAHAASQAWDAEITAGEEDNEAESFVVGESPMFMLKHVESMFIVHNHASPYFDEPEEVAESMGELRRRKALVEHQAWMSVDAMLLDSEPDEATLREAYGQIGRLVAVLASEDTLAVICPQSSQIVPYDGELDQVLRSGDPLEAFGAPSNPPVLEISPDDPRMLAAVAEARQRWPEFVAAFENRTEGNEKFSVKAPFRDDENTEFMWVDVTAIEGNLILGRLGNEPVNVTGVELGGRVRVAVEELNDWIYIQNEQLHGGFTIKVFENLQKEQD